MILILSQIPLALQIEEVSKSMTDTKGDRRLCYGIDADKAMPSPHLFPSHLIFPYSLNAHNLNNLS